MTLSYDDVFSSFLGYVTDYNIASMNMSDAYEMMTEWLHKACSKPYLRRLFSELSFEDDIQVLTFEMEYEKDENMDKDFTLEILSKGMVIEWVQPQVKSKLLTSQFFGGKEQRWFAQANQLDQLRGLLEDTILEQRKMVRDRGYIYNSYLGN